MTGFNASHGEDAKAILEGGPSHLPAESRILRVSPTGDIVKVPHRGGYEHLSRVAPGHEVSGLRQSFAGQAAPASPSRATGIDSAGRANGGLSRRWPPAGPNGSGYALAATRGVSRAFGSTGPGADSPSASDRRLTIVTVGVSPGSAPACPTRSGRGSQRCGQGGAASCITGTAGRAGISGPPSTLPSGDRAQSGGVPLVLQPHFIKSESSLVVAGSGPELVTPTPS
jgi:hypothetical protein